MSFLCKWIKGAVIWSYYLTDCNAWMFSPDMCSPSNSDNQKSHQVDSNLGGEQSLNTLFQFLITERSYQLEDKHTTKCFSFVFCLKGTVHPKMIYTPSCWSKPIWLSYLSGAHMYKTHFYFLMFHKRKKVILDQHEGLWMITVFSFWG